MAQVSSGKKSKQDYETPDPIVRGLEPKFGEVVFDLAAEPHNKKHKRYFGPPLKIIGYTEEDEEITEPNVDPEAVALDSFIQNWSELTKKYGGILWLNPPFRNIEPWAEKFRIEAARGADGMFLVPAAVGANWYLDQIWKPKSADTIFLNGRIPFMGPKQPAYNKDCMVCHFWPGATGKTLLWDWRKNKWYEHEGEEEAVLYTVQGSYVPHDAEYDDGNRSVPFKSEHRFDSKDAVEGYIHRVTGGNRGAIIRGKIYEVRERRKLWKEIA